jgi:hypothetical protein
VGLKFEFFRIIWSLTIKMTSFSIQTVKFEFKHATWTNQESSPSYRPPAPSTGATARASSNASDTALSEWPAGLAPLRPSTSVGPGVTAFGTGSSGRY